MVMYTERDMQEIEDARKVLRKAGLRDTLGYWILVHAHNRMDLGEDHMFLRVGLSSRDAIRMIPRKRKVGAS